MRHAIQGQKGLARRIASEGLSVVGSFGEIGLHYSRFRGLALGTAADRDRRLVAGLLPAGVRTAVEGHA